MTEQNYDVVIVGGGAAGITVAAQLRQKARELSIAIVEPSDKHYYQPLWTLVGGGAATLAETERREADLIPAGVTWLRDRVTTFEPDANQVSTAEHGPLQYKFLVVAAGIQIDWHKIEGLEAALGRDGVCSNYSLEHVEKTWEFIQDFKGGNAIFTFPSTPIKCAGAPQKIMYLFEHHLRKHGLRDQSKVVFASAAGAIFGVKKYADALSKVIADRQIETKFKYDLVAIDGPHKQATFAHVETGERLSLPYDLLHVAPPMSAPDFIKDSPLANEAGWVDVDKATTRHKRFANVFSAGDASSLPTSKTGAAVRKQAPVLVDQLVADYRSQTSTATYDGYTSCPLVTGYGKLILAEFDYDGQPAETFPFDQGKERWSMYMLKKHALPKLYWHGMLRGRA